MHKTYLSREMARSWGTDGTLGDPFGGPAYGKREDVFTAVAAFFETATAFEVVAAVGTALSVVGMVTGNGDLTKIGGAMGLVGGFGALAQGGMFGQGMQTWATDTNTSIMGTQAAAPVSDAIVNNVSTAGVDGASTVTQAGMSNSMSGVDQLAQTNLANSSGLIDTPGSASPTLNTIANQAAAGAPAATPSVSDLAQQSVTPNVDSIAGAPAAATVDAAANPAIDIAKAGEPVNAMSQAASQGGNLAQIKAAGTGINTGTGLFDKILDFANKNSAITQAALTGISKMYTSPYDASVKNATANMYNARTAEITGNIANANAIPNIQSQFAVNPNAQIYNPKPDVTAAGIRPAGLIQSRSA